MRPFGAGGMGEVYRARDTRLDRQVAIKVLPAGAVSTQALERFEREAKAIAALNHPGICAVYDVGTSPVPFLVMELLEGETLHQRLARGRLDVPALLEIGLALADALATAHAKGIVHRDLKPANIVLTPRGPKILDFGLARISETVAQADVDVTAFPTLSGQTPLTDAGVAVGTVAYMSPEQLRGEALDARTDLFSLGLVLYEMATGKRAFSGTTSAVTSAAILHEQPTAPRELQPDIPARFEQAILTLLEKDREVRTQTASELRAELTRLKRELTGSRTPDTVTRSVPVADASHSRTRTGQRSCRAAEFFGCAAHGRHHEPSPRRVAGVAALIIHRDRGRRLRLRTARGRQRFGRERGADLYRRPAGRASHNERHRRSSGHFSGRQLRRLRRERWGCRQSPGSPGGDRQQRRDRTGRTGSEHRWRDGHA